MADQTPTPSKFRGVSLLELNGAEDRATRPDEIHGNPVTFAFQHLETYPPVTFFDASQEHNLEIIDLPRNDIGHCKYSFVDMIVSLYNPNGPYQPSAPYNIFFVLQPAKLIHYTYAIRSQGFGNPDGYNTVVLGLMDSTFNEAYPTLTSFPPSNFPSPIAGTSGVGFSYEDPYLRIIDNGDDEPFTLRLDSIRDNVKVKGLITLS